MKQFIVMTAFWAMTLPAQAKMDDMTYLTEISALANAIALEKSCNSKIDVDAMMSFVTTHFEGRESEVLAQLDGQVTLANFSLKDASDLQKKLLCATSQKYIEKHNLAPAS